MVSIRINAILPKKKFGNKRWIEGIADAQRRKTVPELKRLFNQTVFGWAEKPTWGYAQTRTGDTVSVSVYPQGPAAELYEMVSRGARPHLITARPGSILSFRPGYRPATRPGTLMSGRKYRSGRQMGAKFVNHPGFEPRNFARLVAENYTAAEFANDMQTAIIAVARS